MNLEKTTEKLKHEKGRKIHPCQHALNTIQWRFCHTLVKVKVEVETRVGFIIRKNRRHRHHHRRHRHTGAFNIFLSNSHSILTKVET